MMLSSEQKELNRIAKNKRRMARNEAWGEIDRQISELTERRKQITKDAVAGLDAAHEASKSIYDAMRAAKDEAEHNVHQRFPDVVGVHSATEWERKKTPK